MPIGRILSELYEAGKKRNEHSSEPLPQNVLIRKIDDIPTLHYADKINEIILGEELKTGALFLSGDFVVEYVDEKSYTCAYTLYFQDRKNETYKLSAKTKALDIEKLSETAKKDLKENKSVKFEIPEPSEEVRQKYALSKK